MTLARPVEAPVPPRRRWGLLLGVAAVIGVIAWLAFSGAVLFVISDSLLALDRFAARAKSRQTLVLSSYFAAQWLIAVSVTREVWWPS